MRVKLERLFLTEELGEVKVSKGMNCLDADNLNLIPSFLSVVAAAFSTYAAFKSYSVAKETKRIAERNIIAEHHRPAVESLYELILEFESVSEGLFRSGRDLRERWPRTLKSLDNKKDAGKDPRPLNHVVDNLGEMLAAYAFERESVSCIFQNISSVLSNGVGVESESEFRELLEVGGGSCPDYEVTFGLPDAGEGIQNAPAFKFAIYQLRARLTEAKLRSFLVNGWAEGGYISQYYKIFEEASYRLEAISKGLEALRFKLKLSTYKLEDNPELSQRISDFEFCVEFLQECGLELIDDPDISKSFGSDRYSKDCLIEHLAYLSGLAHALLELENRFFSLRNV